MAEGEGETFAVLTRGAQAATLSQTAKKLQPGKLYKLQYLTGDADGVDGKGSVKPEQCCLTLSLQGATVLPEHTIAFRANERYRGNLDQVVFRADRSEVVLTFSNVSAAPNSRTALNFVTLMPYFEGE